VPLCCLRAVRKLDELRLCTGCWALRTVDHAIAGFEGEQHGFYGVVAELIGAEPEQRHQAFRVQGNRELRDVPNRGAYCVVCR
jgi:hypothetical protein